jgi:hypothetical protein
LTERHDRAAGPPARSPVRPSIGHDESVIFKECPERSACTRRWSVGTSRKAIHIPVTAGGIAIVYNVPGVDNLQLSPATLAGIFMGTIKSWNDPKIAAVLYD